MRKYFLFSICCSFSILLQAQLPKDFMIPVKVIANANTPSITLLWPANHDATSYSVKRKIVTETSYSAAFATLYNISGGADTATTFADHDIQQGTLYEYELSGQFATTLPAERSTYTCGGINIAPTHQRGSIVLVCDSSLVNNIAEKLERLSTDLTGDGWKVIRLDVPRAGNMADVVRVKNKIQDVYNEHHDLKQVFIVGHVPVPYSGNLAPDGHATHQGCWPADGYYGSLSSIWTDTITATFAGRTENKNFPGDGKFDQNYLPNIQLAVGRIDFANLPSFGLSETELIKRYLDKDHVFRMGGSRLANRALVEDNFNLTEKFSQSAWKSYSATTGYNNITVGQYETGLLSSEGYLWSYGSGAGTYTSAGGIGSTESFATTAYHTAFTQLFGSYFGDWDCQNNFMRASLASPGDILTCVWGGRPHWYFHHMAAGLPIGYSTLLTMNNRGVYTNPGFGNAMVHIALMGDPSLRSSFVKPVLNLTANAIDQSIKISWSNNAAAANAGYYIYRSADMNDSFQLLNTTPVMDTFFIDGNPFNVNNTYMVRRVKIDTVITSGSYSNTSTYLNLSTGILTSILFSSGVFCIPADSSSCSESNKITYVQFGLIDTATACSPYGYGDFTAGNQKNSVTANSYASIKVATSCVNNNPGATGLWIDFNNDFIFQRSEFTFLGFTCNDTVKMKISIPANAVEHYARMRIRTTANSRLSPSDACTFLARSETEDYIVSIKPSNCAVNTWIGGEDNNYWDVATNWSCQEVPGDHSVVSIKQGTVIVRSNVTIYSIFISEGVLIDINDGFNFRITH